MNKIYPLFKVHIEKEDALKYISTVIDSGFVNEGVQVSELTEKLKTRFKTQNLLLVNSCTSAIILALHLSTNRDFLTKKQQNKVEIISTPMTCIASNTPILNLGYKLKWCDVDKNTGMIDTNSFLKTITENTKALIVVAWAGIIPNNIEELYSICQSKNIKLILDAAHAFDATFDNKQLYEISDFVCYSFQAIKHFTTGDGGALICSNDNDFKLAKSLKWFGIDRESTKDNHGNWKNSIWDIDVEYAGYKFNMNNISAAIGLSQLNYIDQIINIHRTNAHYFENELLTNDILKNFFVPLSYDKKSNSSFWIYTILLNEKYIGYRDIFIKKLNEKGIMAGISHIPNNQYTCFKSSNKKKLLGVDTFFSRQLSLPCGWWISESDSKYIIDQLIIICNELMDQTYDFI